MRFQVLTIFPELFGPFCEMGLISRAIDRGLVQVETDQLRQYAINTHGQIDDTPYGGGAGMVLRCETAAAAIRAAKLKDPDAKVVLFSPRGKQLTTQLSQALAAEAAEKKSGLILLACRYEGVDERVVETLVDEEISLGDFVLMGGEIAAMALIESVSRFIPEVLGNPESTEEESHQQGLLEYPQYTKPQTFEGRAVPDVLLSGNHQQVKAWRKEQALHETRKRRPDMIRGLADVEINVALIHYPVLNKEGRVIISSVTNLDVHDIARSARTYGLSHYYVVHPTKAMRRLMEKICQHWESGYGSTYNANRKEALAAISVLPDLDDAIADIESRTGKVPIVVTTSAKISDESRSFGEVKSAIYTSERPVLVLLGTGWGLTDEILQRAELHLAPVDGYAGYNHLSVRAAAAVIFDRLFGKPA